MKNQVKSKITTDKTNKLIESIPDGLKTDLDFSRHEAMCQDIFLKVSGHASGFFTAPFLDWLSAKDWLGMQILLGQITKISHSTRIDEAAIFNKIKWSGGKPMELTLKDGCHLHKFLITLVNNRMRDVVRKNQRIVIEAELKGDDRRIIERWSDSWVGAHEIERRDRIATIKRLLHEACTSADQTLEDKVFAHYLEHYDTITQAQLARIFQIKQCKVSRILSMKREKLRSALERELGIRWKRKGRKPRQATPSPGPSGHCAQSTPPIMEMG